MAKDKLYTVKTPNCYFNGLRNGVQFTNGVGKATREAATILVTHWGYSCDELFPEKEVATASKDPNEETEATAPTTKKSKKAATKKAVTKLKQEDLEPGAEAPAPDKNA